MRVFRRISLCTAICCLAAAVPGPSTAVTFTQRVPDCDVGVQCNMINPAWSPQGDYLAYALWFNQGSFLGADISLTPVPNPAVLNFEPGLRLLGSQPLNTRPTWSPSGNKIAFFSFAIWAITSGESTLTLVTLDTNLASNPDWSPIGDDIVFSNKTGDIATVTALGGGTPRVLAAHAAKDLDPVWSSDGAQIAFTSTRSGNSDIWTMSASGNNLRQLTSSNTEDVSPTWSPDSKWIAFASSRSGNWDLFMVSTETGDIFQVTTDPADDADPDWSPDGTQIAFISDRSGSQAIWIASDLTTVAVEKISLSQFKNLYR